MIVRARTDADLVACVALVQAVRAVDRYPRFLPGGSFESFLESPGALGAWVAEDDGALAGHVALHARSREAVLAMASGAVGVPPDGLGVIARLLVSPAHRRKGAARLLLATATAEARARGLWPVLDVVTEDEAAIALYEACGWRRVGRVGFDTAGIPDLEEFVYVAPPGGPCT